MLLRVWSVLPPWIKSFAVLLLSHNNLAESPFALGKWFDHVWPGVRLETAAGLTHAISNGTFRRQQSPGKTRKSQAALVGSKKPRVAGDALTAPAPVRAAINALTSARTSCKRSLLPAQRKEQTQDVKEARAVEERKKTAAIAETKAKKAKVATAANMFSEVGLVTTVPMMTTQLGAKGSTSAKVKWLEEQVHARTKGKGFTYVGIESKFVSESRKVHTVKASSDGGVETQLKYLSELMSVLIAYDRKEKRYGKAALAAARPLAPTIKRPLPVIDETLQCAAVKGFTIADRAEEQALFDVQEDDAKLLDYEARYVGKVFEDKDEEAHFKVVKILWVKGKKGKPDFEAWEASVEVNSRGKIPSSSLVPGTSMVLDKKLVSYGLEDSDMGLDWLGERVL